MCVSNKQKSNKTSEMSSTSVIGEPFGAMPAFQTVNRFAPLPCQVDRIDNYSDCMTTMADAEYFARSQAYFRGGDPSRLEYAEYFHEFAHGPTQGTDNKTYYNMQTGQVAAVGMNGGCRLLLSDRTKKTAWPLAQQQLKSAVAGFHTGQPLIRAPPSSSDTIECNRTYTQAPWACSFY